MPWPHRTAHAARRPHSSSVVRITGIAFAKRPVGQISVQPRSEKYFASPFGRNSFMDSNRPTPHKGRIAIVTDAGRDAVDAAAFCARRDCRAGWRKACERLPSVRTRDAARVRRSRVVLTPRRWRQVRGVKSAQPGLDKTYPLMTVAKEPGHRGEHEGNR